MQFTTNSGLIFDLADPKPEMIDLEDIAKALSKYCRFGGQCDVFYSVAEHSVLVSDFILRKYDNKQLALAGLFHDAHEAYTGDRTFPIKQYPQGPELDLLDEKIQHIINRVFNINISAQEYKSFVKYADVAIFNLECASIFKNYAFSIHEFSVNQCKELGLAIGGLPPSMGYWAFIEQYHKVKD